MSQFRDLIARMAIDAEFARHARANPDAIARQYGLTGEETEQLRGLADAAAGAGPTALGARLSKSGGTFGGVATTLAADLDLTPDLDPKPSDSLPDAGEKDSPPPPTDGDADEPIIVSPPMNIDLSGLGPISLDGGDSEGDSEEQEAMPRDGGSDGERTYEVLGEKGSAGDEPAEAAGEGGSESEGESEDAGGSPGFGGLGGWSPLGSDSDGDGLPDTMDSQPDNPDTTDEPFGDNDGDGQINMSDPTPNSSDAGDGSGEEPDYGGLGDMFPWSDGDGDGLPNMMDSQPDNPDTTDEPYGDNDGDGQINMSDPTPNPMPTLRPDIDLSELIGPSGPQLPDGFEPELHLDDAATGEDAPAEDAPATGETGEPPAPPAETPSGPTGETPSEPASETPSEATAETPSEPTGETPLEPTGETPTEATGETPPSSETAETDTGVVEPTPPAPPAPSTPDAPDTAAAAPDSESDSPVPTGGDDGGMNDFAIGAAGLGAGAVAGGVAGAAAAKALADKGTGQTPAQN